MPLFSTSSRGLLLAVVCWGGAAAAQTGPCADALASAERRYQEQDYAAVEPTLAACVDDPESDLGDVQSGYRLIALSLIRQGQFPEARLTIVRLLGANYDYRPDAVYDPPSYVALVTAVKDQLRVDAGRGGAAVNLNTASEAEIARVDGLDPELARRIVAYRTDHGPFDTLGAVVAVPGVTPRVVERIAASVTVGADVTVER